jgi:hypothetical protein
VHDHLVVLPRQSPAPLLALDSVDVDPHDVRAP